MRWLAIAAATIVGAFAGLAWWFGWDKISFPLATICASDEDTIVCIREWVNPLAAVLTVAAIWYAGRQVFEANRQSDAAVRASLRALLDDLLAESRFQRSLQELFSETPLSQLLWNNGVLPPWLTMGGVQPKRTPLFEEDSLQLPVGEEKLRLEEYLRTAASVFSARFYQEEGVRRSSQPLNQHRSNLFRLAHELIRNFRDIALPPEASIPPSDASDNRWSGWQLMLIHYQGGMHAWFDYGAAIRQEIEVVQEAMSELDDEVLESPRVARARKNARHDREMERLTGHKWSGNRPI
jgi:hypothetical protein